MLDRRIILDQTKFSLTLDRLCRQLIENHHDFTKTVLIGVQPRGIFLAARIKKKLQEILGFEVLYGILDPTFYRDDYRTAGRQLVPKNSEINFSTENKNVVLIDDVLYTGRTTRAAMDALLDFGRPAKIELLVLVDRRFTRHLPIQPDYVGKTVDSLVSERVVVEWQETDGKDCIWITPDNSNTP